MTDSSIQRAFELGNALRDQGKHLEAVAAYRQAISLNPRFAKAHCNLGNVLNQIGDLNAAIESYQNAIAAKADFAQAHHNLGVALGNKGRLEDAVASCRRAAALAPASPQVLRSLANALSKNLQYDEAVAVYRRAIALQPDHAKSHADLGFLLLFLGRLDAAIAVALEAILLDEKLPISHFLLGSALADKCKPEGAITAYRQAIALNPSFAWAHCSLGGALKAIGRNDEAVEEIRKAVESAPEDAGMHSSLILTLHYHPDYDSRAIAEETRRWNQRHAAPLASLIRPHSNDPDPNRRLRIGYVSPDFESHPVGRCLLPLFRHHDRNQFEIYSYAQVRNPDGMTAEFERLSTGWRSIVGLTDQQLADQIRADGIDILLDLTLHSAGNRLLVFARKPAPVQITWLGYPGSTGLSVMDYRLSDPYLDPVRIDETVYSEKTIRLPESFWCYPASADAPDVNPLPAAQCGHITFGCLNNFGKVSDSSLLAWAKIMQGVADSRLLMHAYPGSSRDRVREQMARQGIESHRIEFADRISMPDYFRLYHRIDIGLDTLPFAGGVTTCDALWMGVTVITQIGKTATGRGGYSILSNIGLPDLTASNADEFVMIAAQLAHDLPRLTEFRSSLRKRMQESPLMDASRFARNFESAIRTVWRQRRSSEHV